jgi:hypothetical protein
MAVGFPTKDTFVNGDVYSAGDVNDLAGTVNLLESAQYAAGKNKIINGDFGIWQRGATFTNPASLAYTADRWAIFYNGTGATRTISQQTFTPGTAPVAGYEGQFFYRYAVSVAGTSNTANLLRQYIENVRTVAGQTVTVSFWAKAASSLTIPSIQFTQNFGTGGSPSAGADTNIATSVSVTTSWQRFSYTVTVPSISGKTLGTAGNDALELRFFLPNAASTFTFDIWGVQVEAGSTASPFQTATGTIQGELAACQRYYYPLVITNIDASLTVNRTSTTTSETMVYLPVSMRTIPTISLVAVGGIYGRLVGYDVVFGVTVVNVTAVGLSACFNSQALTLGFTNASLTYAQAAASCSFDNQNVASTIAFSSEL